MGAGLSSIAACQATFMVNARPLSQASQLPQGIALADERVDNSGLVDFDRALPTVDVALAGAGDGQLRLIHILVDG